MDLAAEQPGARRVAFVHRHTRHTTQPLLANFNVCERSWPSETHSYRHDTNTYFASHFGRQSVGWSLIKMCHFVVFARNVKPRWISSGRCCTARSGTLLTTSGCSQTPGPAEGKYSETSHRTGQHSTAQHHRLSTCRTHTHSDCKQKCRQTVNGAKEPIRAAWILPPSPNALQYGYNNSS